MLPMKHNTVLTTPNSLLLPRYSKTPESTRHAPGQMAVNNKWPKEILFKNTLSKRTVSQHSAAMAANESTTNAHLHVEERRFPLSSIYPHIQPTKNTGILEKNSI